MNIKRLYTCSIPVDGVCSLSKFFHELSALFSIVSKARGRIITRQIVDKPKVYDRFVELQEICLYLVYLTGKRKNLKN